MSDKWAPLTKCPHERFSNPIFISPHECVVAPYNYAKQKSDGILKYNSTNGKWTTFIRYPKDCQISNCSLSIDERERKIYLIGAESIVYIIHVDEHKITKLPNGRIEVGVNPSTLFIDGQLHIIGGSRNKSHLIRTIYNEQDAEDEKDQTFHKVFEFEDWGKGSQNAGLVYVRSKNQIILFGGYTQYCEYRFSDLVWIYDLSAKPKDRKWVKKLKMPERCCFFGYALTDDERYIVLIGGYSNDKKAVRKVFILDVDTMKFMKAANISTPASGSVRAAVDEDNYIHLFKHDSGNQWKINIRSLISAYNSSDENYAYQLVKKYKRLLKVCETENRQMKIELNKQKQINDRLEKTKNKNKNKKATKDDELIAQNKKMKKRIQELEQQVQQQSVEIQRWDEKSKKQNKYIDDLEAEKMKANNSNLQQRLQIKELQGRLGDLEGDAEELQSIEDFLKRQEKVAKKQEKALHAIEAESK
eukprot:227058_1